MRRPEPIGVRAVEARDGEANSPPKLSLIQGQIYDGHVRYVRFTGTVIIKSQHGVGSRQYFIH